MPPADWFLDATERGNPWTTLDSRHADRRAWTSGNRVRPLVHGADYFAELLAALEATGAGDLVMFAGWRMDADQRLGPGRDTGIAAVLSRASRRGVDVRGLLWRSQPAALRFSAEQNAIAARTIESAGGSACWTCASGPTAPTTRSSSSCAMADVPTGTSPSSAGSTCAAAAATTARTPATRRPR